MLSATLATGPVTRTKTTMTIWVMAMSEDTPCKRCKGEGELVCRECPEEGDEECPTCAGECYVECAACEGSGMHDGGA